MHFCPDCRRIYQQPVEFCSADGAATQWIERGNDPLVGVRFDERFELVRQIGAGGNGVVYLARQLELNRLVAFKMMYAERMQEPRALKRFAREARALAALDHPGCVRVHDFRAPEDSVPYLVMDLVEGHPLGDVMAVGGIPVHHAVHTALRIAEAVDAAHRAGIVHRDLKPENVILDVKEAELRVRLIDFGLAIVVQDEGAEDRLTRQGRVVGTPDYMSPEQVRGGDADGRSDLYALGILLYEMIEGAPPFHGSTPSATAAMHLEDEPPPLRAGGLSPDLHDKLSQLIMGLLAKRPEDRPSTGAEVADSLEGLLNEIPEAGSAATLLERVDDVHAGEETKSLGSRTESGEIPVVAPPHPVAVVTAPARRGPARTTLVVGGALLLGAAVGVGLLVANRPTDAPAPPETTAPPDGTPDPAEFERPEGRLEVDPQASADGEEPTAGGGLREGGTIEMPGGDAQQDYEAVLRALSAALAAEGLRPRDVRSSPRGARAWVAQSQAARTQNYAGAMEHLGALRAESNTRTAHEWMVYRLQAVERRLGDPPPRAMVPRLRALWGTLDASAASPAGVRRFMTRVDELERTAR